MTRFPYLFCQVALSLFVLIQLLADVLTMLRLASTRIILSPSDLDWHVRRHEKRKAELKKGKLSNGTVHSPSTQPLSPEPQYELGGSSRSGQPAAGDTPIYSNEPVPRDSQAFWDKILADAGSSARIHQASMARLPQVIVPSDTFLEANGSVRLSIRGEIEEDHIGVQSGSVPEELLISPRSPVSDPETMASIDLQSRLSPFSPPSRESSLESFDVFPSTKQGVGTEDASISHASRRSRGRGTDSQDPWVNQMDVDGPSDTAPKVRHYPSTSSLHDPEPTAIGMPFGAQGRKAELAASRNACGAHAVMDSAIPFVEPQAFDQFLRDECAGSSHAQHIRTRSGGLPRSRLYISEAAASSSPDKRPRSPVASHSEAPINESGLLSLPPRRRKGYKFRSETYSNVSSTEAHKQPGTPPSALAMGNSFDSAPDEFSHAQQAQAGTVFSNHDNYAIRTPSESVPRTSNDIFSSSGSVRRYNAASSPSYRSNVSQSSHSSSTYPQGLSSQSQDVPSIDLLQLSGTNTSMYANPLSQPVERFPTRTRSVSRITSTTYNIPTTDENIHLPGSPYLPSTPPRSTSSTSMHHTPTRLSIYNDRLPASLQPQTPIGLPRNGLPPMSLQNPFFTAPARTGARARRGVAGWLHSAFATPSRASQRRELGAWRRRDGQENVSVEDEVQRAERREREEQARRNGWGDGRTEWRMSDWEQ